MPLYEHECQKCKNRTEVVRKFSDPVLTTCETCGGDLKKLISSPAIQFKGSGFYINDYARSRNSADGAKDSKADSQRDSGAVSRSESGGESKSDSKGDSKGDSKSDSKGDSKSDSSGSAGAESKSTSAGESKAASVPSPSRNDSGTA